MQNSICFGECQIYWWTIWFPFFPRFPKKPRFQWKVWLLHAHFEKHTMGATSDRKFWNIYFPFILFGLRAHVLFYSGRMWVWIFISSTSSREFPPMINMITCTSWEKFLVSLVIRVLWLLLSFARNNYIRRGGEYRVAHTLQIMSFSVMYKDAIHLHI